MALVPYVEAIEQTILQKVVPYERQGRVFGFAQSVEQLASPLTAFFIGPVTQIFFIPFMTTGKGVELIGSWYGVGQGRGIGLVFTIAGILGLIITLFSMKTKSYKLLEETYLNNKSED
jgi:DHA3 family multidrug efflux protein-like MFS transporter